MIRRFNYTGRQRITSEHISIRLTPPKPVRMFEAQISLTDNNLPLNAAVYLEAFEKTTIMRFPFGTVAQLLPPSQEERRLKEFEGTDAFNFRVKVVDNSGYRGRILAESAPIQPVFPEDKEQRRRSLLPVRYGQIGEQPWKVEYPEGYMGDVKLLINNDIPDMTAFTQSAEFTSLVLPSVLREILLRVGLYEDNYDPDDSSDWRCNWLRFASQLGGPELPNKDESEPEEVFDWADSVVDAFCSRHGMYTRYSRQLEQSDG